MSEHASKVPGPRPYFLPESIQYDDLPPTVRAALQAVIEPSYTELVLGALTALERSEGVTLCFLGCLEILDQFEIGRGMNLGQGGVAPATDRDQQIAPHLRLINSKQQAANFLLRLRMFRRTRDCDPFIPSSVYGARVLENPQSVDQRRRVVHQFLSENRPLLARWCDCKNLAAPA